MCAWVTSSPMHSRLLKFTSVAILCHFFLGLWYSFDLVPVAKEYLTTSIMVQPLRDDIIFSILGTDQDNLAPLLAELNYRYPDIPVVVVSSAQTPTVNSIGTVTVLPYPYDMTSTPALAFPPNIGIKTTSFVTSNSYVAAVEYASRKGFETVVMLDGSYRVDQNTTLDSLLLELSSLGEHADVVSPVVCYQQLTGFQAECDVTSPDLDRTGLGSFIFDSKTNVLSALSKAGTIDPRGRRRRDQNGQIHAEHHGVQGSCFGVNIFPTFFVGHVAALKASMEESFYTMSDPLSVICPTLKECLKRERQTIAKQHVSFTVGAFLTNLKVFQCPSSTVRAYDGDVTHWFEWIDMRLHDDIVATVLNTWPITALQDAAGAVHVLARNANTLLPSSSMSDENVQIFDIPDYSDADEVIIMYPQKIDVIGPEGADWQTLQNALMTIPTALYNSKSNGYARFEAPEANDLTELSFWGGSVQVLNPLTVQGPCSVRFHVDLQASFSIPRIGGKLPDRLIVQGVLVDPGCPMLWSDALLPQYLPVAVKLLSSTEETTIQHLYFVTTMKNQCEYAPRLIEQLRYQALLNQEKTSLGKTVWIVELVITDFESEECDTNNFQGEWTMEELMRDFNTFIEAPQQQVSKVVSKVTVLKINGDFSRSRGLNNGLEHVSAMHTDHDNVIVYMIDTSQIIPLDFFTRLKSSFICGYSFFVPVVQKVATTSHEEALSLRSSADVDTFLAETGADVYTVYSGYGMIGGCLADLVRVQGYDYAKWGDKWGMEDTDLVSRLVKSSGLLPIRRAEHGMYHASYSSASHRGRSENEMVIQNVGVVPHLLDIPSTQTRLLPDAIVTELSRLFPDASLENTRTVWDHLVGVLTRYHACHGCVESVIQLTRVETTLSRYLAIPPYLFASPDSLTSATDSFFIMYYTVTRNDHIDSRVAISRAYAASHLIDFNADVQHDEANAVFWGIY